MAEMEKITIREAEERDQAFVLESMEIALNPYYGGDHSAHARRIFATHISGGQDRLGYFSFEQKMFIADVDETPAAMLNLVGKRQGTYKISPLIVAPAYRGTRGLGTQLLAFGESYARQQGARQMYCTVAEQNHSALQFFIRKGYIVAGRSDSHYKAGATEVMLYKLFLDEATTRRLEEPNISVLPCRPDHESQVRALLLQELPAYFRGIDSTWVDALFGGYERRGSRDINQKYKLIFVAVDRNDSVLGVAGATPKKGEPIKLMPFLATTLPAFHALVVDVPYALREYGRKVYLHATPSVDQTIVLQQRGWRLDAAMPGAYHDDHVTQQWSLDIAAPNLMRLMRVKQPLLDQIKSGRKTLEVRVGYDTIKTIQPGERIELASRNDKQIIRVSDIRRYASFEEMLTQEQPDRIVPGSSHDQVLDLLRRIYPPQRERLGVIVLDIHKEP